MIVFLTEEASMKELLSGIIHTQYPSLHEGLDWHIIAYQGKADLEKNIQSKMRSWNYNNPHFIILRDNDGGDCLQLKSKLANLASETGKPHHIRIVCQELEAWLLGDADAVKKVFPHAPFHNAQRTYRNPDNLNNASQILTELTGSPSKVSRAQDIAPHLSPSRNASKSFQVFHKTLISLLS